MLPDRLMPVATAKAPGASGASTVAVAVRPDQYKAYIAKLFGMGAWPAPAISPPSLIGGALEKKTFAGTARTFAGPPPPTHTTACWPEERSTLSPTTSPNPLIARAALE